MKRFIILFCTFFISVHVLIDAVKIDVNSSERLFVFVTAGYNNKEWYDRNLSSIFSQNYKNFHLIYVDDCSTDGTSELVQEWAEKHGVADRITLIRNSERMGAMANQYKAIHMLPDGAVVCIVDGDDWLAGPNVLTHLNKLYADPVWLTHGQFIVFPGGQLGWCRDIPQKYIDTNGFRDDPHNLSHLRTFYAGLFKQIKKEDLMFEGKFLKMCADNAAMFPMAEMARGHIKFNAEVLLVWNGASSINDHKVVKGLQRQLDLKIRSWPRYDKLETPFNDGQEVSIDQIKANVKKVAQAAVEEGYKEC